MFTDIINKKISKNFLLLIFTLFLPLSQVQAGVPNFSNVETAVLIEHQSARVLLEKKKDVIRPIASMTKIMTLYLAMEALQKGQFSLKDKIKASTLASKIGGSQVYLKENEELSAEEILKSIAIQSANDSSFALAEFLAGDVSSFVTLMNKKAAKLGLNKTSFSSPHGLPSPNKNDDKSTAYEISLLSRSFIKEYPEILKYTSIRMDYIRNEQFQLINTNRLMKDFPGMDGLKTGYIRRSGFCLSATAKRNNMRLIAVVMGGKSKKLRFDTVRDMLEYGFTNYQKHILIHRGKTFSIAVNESKTLIVAAHLNNNIQVVVNPEELNQLKFYLFAPHGLKAPLPAGSKLAEYGVKLNGKILAKSDVVASIEIFRANFLQRIYRRFFQ